VSGLKLDQVCLIVSEGASYAAGDASISGPSPLDERVETVTLRSIVLGRTRNTAQLVCAEAEGYVAGKNSFLALGYALWLVGTVTEGMPKYALFVVIVKPRLYGNQGNRISKHLQ